MRVCADAAPARSPWGDYELGKVLLQSSRKYIAFVITFLFAVLLSWNQVTTYSNGTALQQPIVYEVWRSMNNPNNFVLVGTSSSWSFQDTTVANNKNYYYFVQCRVVTTGARSGPSNTFKIKT